MPRQNTHLKAVRLREAAQAFAEHDPDLDSEKDPDDKKGQRLNAALLTAAMDYARAVDPNFHICTSCEKPIPPRFEGALLWCSCRYNPPNPT